MFGLEFKVIAATALLMAITFTTSVTFFGWLDGKADGSELLLLIGGLIVSFSAFLFVTQYSDEDDFNN